MTTGLVWWLRRNGVTLAFWLGVVLGATTVGLYLKHTRLVSRVIHNEYIAACESRQTLLERENRHWWEKYLSAAARADKAEHMVERLDGRNRQMYGCIVSRHIKELER